MRGAGKRWKEGMVMGALRSERMNISPDRLEPLKISQLRSPILDLRTPKVKRVWGRDYTGSRGIKAFE